MDQRQLMVCAIALFADGYEFNAIATALGVSRDEAAKLAALGGDEQAAGTMGYMAPTLDTEGNVVNRGE